MMNQIVSHIQESSDPLGFAVGTRIRVKNHQSYQVIDLLQKSGRRTVYTVKLVTDDNRLSIPYILKCESVKDTDEKYKIGLRQERYLSHAVVKATPMEAERFSEFAAYGEKKNCFNFIIWKKLGPSLAELFQVYEMKFSIKTAVRINVQTLQAIQKIHELGFVHRNIHPEHFLVGEHSKKVIYIISFTLSKCYADDRTIAMDTLDCKKRTWNKRKDPNDANISREISSSKQYFCSRYFYTADCGNNLSRIDDLESWFYMCLYFIDPSSIPWKDVPYEMISDIYNIKMDLFFHFHDHTIFQKIPIKYRRIIDEINSTVSGHTPQYEKFFSIITDIVKDYCNDMNIPYDWEEIPGKLMSDFGNFKIPGQNKDSKTSEEDIQLKEKFDKLILDNVSRPEAYKILRGCPDINYPGQILK